MEGSGAIPLKCMFYPANGFLGFMLPRLRTKPHSRFRLFRHHCLRTGACPGKVGMIGGVFYGLAFGMGRLGSAVLGNLADLTSITSSIMSALFCR